MIKSPLPQVICGSDRKTVKIFVVEYLNGTNFRGFFFLEKNCISRVFIFAVCPFKDFFAGINFRGLDKSKHFAATNFRDLVRNPRQSQKLVPAKISTIKVAIFVEYLLEVAFVNIALRTLTLYCISYLELCSFVTNNIVLLHPKKTSDFDMCF